jgi:iron complex transport system ATP-binding protein
MIGLEAVSVAYGSGPRVVDALSEQVASGEWLGLIGPNGAGKSSVLRAIAGLLDHEGRIVVDGRPTSELRRRDLARAMAYVPQQPVLPSDMTVVDYVLLGRTAYIGYFGVEGRRDRAICADLIDRLELSAFAGRRLSTLSGGELQRLVLARALAQEAPILLLDEPTSALDIGHQQQALELVDQLRREHGLTVLSAMHDLTLASQFADRLLLLQRGVVVARGAAPDVLTESNIATHYGAVVRVLRDDDGRVVVVPMRPGGVSPPPPGASRTAAARGPHGR